MPHSNPTQPWTRTHRMVFRFGFVYLLLYLLPFPAIGPLRQAYRHLWQVIVLWVGEHLLRLERPILYTFNGSGDMTFHYVQLLCFMVLAGLGALCWSLLASSLHYQRLHGWLRCYVRYFLASAMLGYGFAKVFVLQFPMPAPELMVMSYAESSPMGLLWRFMGASPGYTIFGGALELFGGMLLFWRRTTTLGALVVGGVMANVVALNFCYDVPVKIFSTHLLMMTLFLLLPEARRLFDFFVRNRATAAVALEVAFPQPWIRHGRLVLKSLFISFALFINIVGVLEWRSRYDSKPESAALYEVESFVYDGVARPPLLTDPIRWRWVSTWQQGLFQIRWMNETTQRFQMEQDPKARTITLIDPQAPNQRVLFTYEESAPGRLVLEGQFRGGWLRVQLKRLDLRASPLFSRGFHWINEHPYYQ